MNESVIGFIGLGLIGGSLARALKKHKPDLTVMAYMRSRDRLEKGPRGRGWWTSSWTAWTSAWASAI